MGSGEVVPIVNFAGGVTVIDSVANSFGCATEVAVTVTVMVAVTMAGAL